MGHAIPKRHRCVSGDHGKTVKGPKGEDIEVQFVYRDAASGGADKAKQFAEELILRENVKMLAGFELSPHAMAVGEIATQAKMPVVIMNAATASITRGSPYYVRTSVTMPQWCASIGKWAAENGIKKVYTIVSDYAPGHRRRELISTRRSRPAAARSSAAPARRSRKPTSRSTWNGRCRRSLTRSTCSSPAARPRSRSSRPSCERGLKQAGIKLLGNGEFAELYLPNFSDDVIGTISVNHYTETNTLPENKS